MDVAITTMSTKGQVVIPLEMRQDIKEGEKLLIIKSDESIIMKRISKLEKKLKSDLAFAKRTEEAYAKYEKGEFRSKDLKEFLKEMKQW